MYGPEWIWGAWQAAFAKGRETRTMDGKGEGEKTYYYLGLLLASQSDAFSPVFFRHEDHFLLATAMIEAEEKGFDDCVVVPVETCGIGFEEINKQVKQWGDKPNLNTLEIQQSVKDVCKGLIHVHKHIDFVWQNDCFCITCEKAKRIIEVLGED
jgi:hypothetical protein